MIVQMNTDILNGYIKHKLSTINIVLTEYRSFTSIQHKNEQTLFFGANEKRTIFSFTMKAIDVFCDSMFATNSMQQ